MIDIFIIWIIVQLVIIGVASDITICKIRSGVYSFNESETKTSPWFSAFFPLIWFVSESEEYKEARRAYKKKYEKKLH